MENKDQIAEKLLDLSGQEKTQARLAQISSMLLWIGFLCLPLAGFFIYSGRFSPLHYRNSHGEFTLNANRIGQIVLVIGVCFYFAGRGLAYYQRFKKKSEY